MKFVIAVFKISWTLKAQQILTTGMTNSIVDKSAYYAKPLLISFYHDINIK